MARDLGGLTHQQPCLECSRAVPRDGQVGALRVLETEIETAAGERRDFLDPRRVDDRAAVDAEEVPRIQQRLQLRDRVVDAVRLSALDGERQLVLGVEVRDPDQIDEPQALARSGYPTKGTEFPTRVGYGPTSGEPAA